MRAMRGLYATYTRPIRDLLYALLTVSCICRLLMCFHVSYTRTLCAVFTNPVHASTRSTIHNACKHDLHTRLDADNPWPRGKYQTCTKCVCTLYARYTDAIRASMRHVHDTYSHAILRPLVAALSICSFRHRRRELHFSGCANESSLQRF